MLNVSYLYKIEASYVKEKEEIILENESIESITIDYNYDNNNMPILYMGLNIKSDLYDDMVNNMDTSTIVLTIYKYNSNSIASIKDIYIKSQFIYIIPTDSNYTKSIENKAGNTAINYKRGAIALLKVDIMNNNKKLINDIIKDSNIISIVNKYTNNMNMVIEPFKYNNKFKSIIIPPINSITKLLEYLDSIQAFYKNGYRYFMDFDKTYLLSNSGNPIDCKDNKYNTIFIHVMDPSTDKSKYDGFEIDKNKKAYIINVDALDTNMSIDKITDKSFNSIIGVTSLGDISKININIAKNINSSEKIKLERIHNDNMDQLLILKNNIESISTILNVNKSDIDLSLLTPNREYFIHNYSDYSMYNGKYILSYKKELIVRQDDNFISGAMFGFRKIIE